MKYKIIRDNYLRIDDQVNDHLTTGWELHGFPYAMGSIIMQAMTLKESSKEQEDKEIKQGRPNKNKINA
jgi:hypothetical protein